jgi:hypothetical protein
LRIGDQGARKSTIADQAEKGGVEQQWFREGRYSLCKRIFSFETAPRTEGSLTHSGPGISQRLFDHIGLSIFENGNSAGCDLLRSRPGQSRDNR